MNSFELSLRQTEPERRGDFGVEMTLADALQLGESSLHNLLSIYSYLPKTIQTDF